MNRRARIYPRRLGCRGAGTMEFALVAAVFFSLLLGGIEVARYMTIVQSLRNLTGEAARAALIANNGGAAWSASAVKGLVPFLDASKITISPATPSCTANLITVSASYPFTSVVPFFTSMNSTLTTAKFTTRISC